MSADERSTIRLRLIGAQQVLAGLSATTAGVDRLSAALGREGVAAEVAGKRSWAANQALFTMRRYAYAATLGLTAMAIGAGVIGVKFDSAMQDAKAALTGFLPSTQAINDELNLLFRMAARTPFQFKDLTIAFRQMYPVMSKVGISASEVNDTLGAMIDNLAASGRTSPAQLNRVSVALQHMALMGHLTGFTLNQLARDGVNMSGALVAAFHLSGEQLHNVGALGIPVQAALRAYIDYINKTPGYAGAAWRIQERTLYGRLTTFKDYLSQAMGSAESGGFGSVFKFFGRLNIEIDNLTGHGKRPVTIEIIIQAMDKATGSGGKLVFLFHRLEDTLGTIVGMVRNSLLPALGDTAIVTGLVVVPMISLLSWNFGVLGHQTNILRWALFFLILAWTGTKIALFINNVLIATQIVLFGILIVLYRTLWIAQVLHTLWTDRETIAEMLSVLWLLYKAIALNRVYMMMKLVIVWSRVLWAYTLLAAGGFEAMTIAIYGATMAMIEFLLTNPIGWIILAIAAFALLYWRWKAFRDVVNSFIMFLWNNPLAAFFLGPLGLLINMVHFVVLLVDHFRDLVRWAKEAAGWVGKAASGGGGGISGAIATGVLSVVPGMPILGLMAHATGGYVSPGLAIVGERGPELIKVPMGSSITPEHSSLGLRESINGFPSELNLKTILKVDGKELASVVSKHRLDSQARS